MSKQDSHRPRDPSMLWHLSSLHSSAVRGYYTYAYLRKLLRSQERTIWEDLSTTLQIAASVIGLILVVQNPASITLVLIAYSCAMLLIIGVAAYERRYRREKGLDDVVYLGIYFDEVSDLAHEIELARSYRDSKEVRRFIDDRKDALRGSLGYLHNKIAKLRANDEYPDCLKKIGRTEEWVQTVNARVRSILESGFLD